VRALGIPAGLSGIKRRFLRVGTPHAPKNKWSYRLTFKLGLTDFVGISEECINVFKNEVPEMISHLTISKITNGIDVNKFVPIKKEIGTSFIFGNCCRLTEQKGLKLFIQTIYELKAKGHFVKGVIAGDGEQKTELLDLCKQLHLESEMEFIGHIEKTEEFYPTIDCLLFTSYFEGTARTILEAYACERPVIAFAASSMEEMITDGVDGYLAKAFEVDDLVLACEKILAQKKSLPEFGIRGRDKVLKEFNNQNAYQKWVNLIVVM
jgi:glycosyltransferase involved in cell wall biosynthesis